MLPFDVVFNDLARKESRAVALNGPDGRLVGSFLFREHFCVEADCDCGIVLIHAVWAERRQVAASFSYSFEPFHDEPQLELDPLNPQSELSDVLVDMFERSLTEDAAYRPTLLRHYRMWRDVVDDPSHPDHGKFGGLVHGKPSAERGGRNKAKKARQGAAAPQRAKEERQRTLPFVGATTQSGAVETITAGLKLVARGPKSEGKLQQRFRKLLEKVDRLKLHLTGWRDRRADIDSEIAMCHATQRRNDELVRRMAVLLDGAHGKLSKPDRKFVSEIIVDLVGDLLRDRDETEEGDEDLRRLYERHARRDFAESQAAEAAEMKVMLQALGVELDDQEDLRTPEQVLQHLKEELEGSGPQRKRAGDEQRAQRKRSAKQIAADARRAEEARDAHKAVQDVYRDLARAAHPDREPDPAERERKTTLMREINAAYEARDLLALLELQLRLERVEAQGSLESLAEERIVRYIHVLDEQAKQLTVELEAIEHPFRRQLGRGPRQAITPAMVLDQIREDIRTVESIAAQLADDLSQFEDIARLKRWLKEERAAARRKPIPHGGGPFDIPF